MRISDWSSDVCSSDLRHVFAVLLARLGFVGEDHRRVFAVRDDDQRRTCKDAIQGFWIIDQHVAGRRAHEHRSEEHTSELQSLMRISYAVFCLKKKNTNTH